jgi:hypothetical protein
MEREKSDHSKKFKTSNSSNSKFERLFKMPGGTLSNFKTTMYIEKLERV